MKARVLIALALLFLMPATAPARTQSDASQLASVVGTLLAQAPQNFTAMRLARDEYDTDFASYKVKPFGTHCRACTMYDNYARGTYKENWYVQDHWDLPGKWAAAKTETYALQALRGILSGFALHRTVSKYSKYPTLTWRDGSRWVYVDTFSGGYTIRVGHDLARPVHVLHPPTHAQIGQLTQAAQNMLRLGVPAGSENFAGLRISDMHRNPFGQDEYGVNVTFGPMIRKCSITDVANSFGYKDFQPKWVLTCYTVAMASSEAALKGTLRASILAALPDGFTESTDPGDLLMDDYRWVKQDAMESIDVYSQEDNGTVRFVMSVYHYLPKAPAD